MKAFAVYLLVATLSTAFAQYDYKSRENYSSQSEQNKHQNRMRGCDGFVCSPPQVCKVNRGVPGCFDKHEGSASTEEDRSPIQVEPEITAKRAYLESQNVQHGHDQSNTHLIPGGYNAPNQHQHHVPEGHNKGVPQITIQDYDKEAHNFPQGYNSSNPHHAPQGHNPQNPHNIHGHDLTTHRTSQGHNSQNTHHNLPNPPIAPHDHHQTTTNRSPHGYSSQNPHHETQSHHGTTNRTPQGHNSQSPHFVQHGHDSTTHRTPHGYNPQNLQQGPQGYNVPNSPVSPYSHDSSTTNRTPHGYTTQNPHHVPHGHDATTTNRTPHSYNTPNPHIAPGHSSENLHHDHAPQGYNPQNPHQPPQSHHFTTTSRTPHGYYSQNPHGHDSRTTQRIPQQHNIQGHNAPQLDLYPNLHPSKRPAYPGLSSTPQPYHRGGYPAGQNGQGRRQYYPGYPYQQNYGNFYPNQQGVYVNYGNYRPTPTSKHHQ